MTQIRSLLAALAEKEESVLAANFFAPCVPGNPVWLRADGLIYTFKPEPKDFEGWGIFEPLDETTVRLVSEATPAQTDKYLRTLPPIRLRLSYRIAGGTWLAYPVNEADARQRLGSREPQELRLVSQGEQFEQVVARWDGSQCWFEEIDRRADPLDAERLRAALRDATLPAHLSWKGCTPEMRGCFVQAQRQGKESQHHRSRQLCDEERLSRALQLGGGRLVSFQDCGDCWEVEWILNSGGYTHTSFIEKHDLTVMIAGICLDNRDRDFDLQSLPKVYEEGGHYW